MNPLKKIITLYKILIIIRSSIGSLCSVPQVKNLDAFLLKWDAHDLGLQNSFSLDIGCGAKLKNPFNAQNLFGIDIRENLEKGVKHADLTLDPIPFEDSFFDFITAYDFLEHVPRIIYCPDRRFPFVELMNEIWRALKPNGIFLSHTPIYPYAQVFQDPTHVNILTTETFPYYFDDKNQYGKIYGFNGSFKILHQVIRGPHLISILQKSSVKQ